MMPTMPSRAEMAKRACRLFAAQTWEDRELVIVSKHDLEFDPMEHVGVQKLVTFIKVPDVDIFKTGDLRNIAIANATGDFIATWDDDDLSHPDRLMHMVPLLRDDQTADAIYLGHHITAIPHLEKYFITHDRKWECTALYRRHRIPVYSSLRRGSDTPVINNIVTFGLYDVPHLYMRIHHGDNTWPPSHYLDHWDRRRRDCTDEEITATKHFLNM